MSHDWIDGRRAHDLRPVIYTPAVIDASAFQLLLPLLTRWLDRQEREVLHYLLEDNRVLRRQLRVDACS